MQKAMRKYSENLAKELVSRLPKPPNKFRTDFLKNYYSKFNITSQLKFNSVTEERSST